MNMKRFAQWVLLGLVGAGLAYAVLKPGKSDSPEHSPSNEGIAETAAPAATVASEGTAAVEVANASAVTVTYFTTRARCVSCRKIEAMTKDTLTELFASELAAGTLRYETISIDAPGNEHYIQDYQLSFKTVVVANGKNDSWQKLDEVWQLMGDAEKFKAFVAAAIRKQLEGVS
jgi:hypothetical protein